MATTTDKLGAKPAEKYRALLAEAKRAREGNVSFSHAWRQEFSALVASKYPSDEKGTKTDQSMVYSYLLNLNTEQIGELRLACIGEEADLAYRMRTMTRKKTISAKRVGSSGSTTAADEARRAELDTEYENKLSKIPPDARTVDNLIAVMSKPRLFVRSYLFAHPEFALRLTDGAEFLASLKTS